MNASSEDYLEALLVLKERHGQVRAMDVAHALGYTKASVSIAMRKLREGGYVVCTPEHLLELTDQGRKIAALVWEKHQVLTLLLRSFGVPEEQAAADACRMEHTLSDISFHAIRARLTIELPKNIQFLDATQTTDDPQNT